MTGRRVHERYDCELPATLLHAEEEIAGVVSNISLGGMYVVTERTFAYGTELKVRFTLPALKQGATVDATVRWVKPDGVGVQFGSLRAIEVWALNQFFKGLSVTAER
ncbi:MAG: PilZ domain-containing protein [Myxococcales bacterium]|nr:PilZ domain-containing protein [Myxococcales bacterium]